jgi:transposase-like protein
MYLGRAIIRGTKTVQDVTKEYDVKAGAVRGWVRQARKLAAAESDAGAVGRLSGKRKKPAKKKTASTPVEIQEPTPTKPAPVSVKRKGLFDGI